MGSNQFPETKTSLFRKHKNSPFASLAAKLLFCAKPLLVLFRKIRYGGFRDKRNYLVRNEKDKYEAANLLANIMNRIHKLRTYLIENQDNYSNYKSYINRLENNLRPDE